MSTQLIRMIQKIWTKSVMRRSEGLALLLVSSLLLAGCATNSTQQANITSGPSMAESYQAAMQEANGNSLNRVRVQLRNQLFQESTTGTVAKTPSQQAINQAINDRFPRLPNPNIVIYVYPHLAGDLQMPVNGYYSAVPFYNQVHYAIPGEMEGT